ncbi:MAG TPA: zinc-dependent alcohol dehydrogenase family protein [Streptosporangiaceae bacterium]|nr:zinc-dependent alcohol dehydrogenase family protein [Streptosporangiaceae bacterium]
MKAVRYAEPEHWQLADLPDPEPGPGEIRVRVRATGVCGTDVHLHHGEFGHVYPLVPGHEVIGEVDQAGPEVDTAAGGLAPGTLVAVDNMVSCGTCAMCRQARPAFCASLRAMGVFEDGGFAEYLNVPAVNCHPASDLGPDVAVLAEPTACALHGIDILAPKPGSDALIFGAGPTGLILAQLLSAAGAARVTVAAPTAAKLELAAGWGAETVLATRADPGQTARQLRDKAPDGFDVVIDATGVPAVLEQCPPLTAVGGTILVYGVTPEQAVWPVSPYDVFRRELTIKGSFSQAFSFDRALRMLRAGRVRTDGMITHRFGLAGYGDALAAVSGDTSCLKAIIEP